MIYEIFAKCFIFKIELIVLYDMNHKYLRFTKTAIIL